MRIGSVMSFCIANDENQAAHEHASAITFSYALQAEMVLL